MENPCQFGAPGAKAIGTVSSDKRKARALRPVLFVPIQYWQRFVQAFLKLGSSCLAKSMVCGPTASLALRPPFFIHAGVRSRFLQALRSGPSSMAAFAVSRRSPLRLGAGPASGAGFSGIIGWDGGPGPAVTGHKALLRRRVHWTHPFLCHLMALGRCRVCLVHWDLVLSLFLPGVKYLVHRSFPFLGLCHLFRN